MEHFLQGISQREIAAKNGWSTATTSRYMKHAIEKLREQLNEKHLSIAALPALLGAYSHMIVPPELAMSLGKMALASGYANTAGMGVPKVVLLWGTINKFWLVLSLALAMTLAWALWKSVDYQPAPPRKPQTIHLFGETVVAPNE